MALAELPRIERLDLATVELPADHPAADLGRSVAVHGFLIDHPDGAILVDTGVGFGNAFIDELYQPSRAELGERLAAVGVELDDVVAVVNSHLHFDHCGQNPALFGGATAFYAQAAEIDAVEADRFYTDADLGARARRPTSHSTVTSSSPRASRSSPPLVTPRATSRCWSKRPDGGW